MCALNERALEKLAVACLSFVFLACGSADDGAGRGGASGTGGFYAGGFGGAASGASFGAGGIIGAGGILPNGGVSATGGMLTMGTGGIPPATGGVPIDPGPPPTGQILACRGTGPCRIDDHDACCIGATTDSQGNVVSISENCIPPGASCNYPFSLAHCDGPEDCRQTDVCCGTLKPYGNVPLFGDVSCAPAGQCTGSGKYVVCRQGITACPVGTTCGSFPTLPADITVCR